MLTHAEPVQTCNLFNEVLYTIAPDSSELRAFPPVSLKASLWVVVTFGGIMYESDALDVPPSTMSTRFEKSTAHNGFPLPTLSP